MSQPMNQLTEQRIQAFGLYLQENERAPLTIEKYLQELRRLMAYLAGAPMDKARLFAYRETLQQRLQAGTVNGKLAAINGYLQYAGLSDCKIKYLKVQRSAFVDDEKYLSEREYGRLLEAAQRQKNQRLYYLLLTLGNTGIRVSELPFITVEALQRGKAEIRLKGKNRLVLLPRELTARLRQYAKSQDIQTGAIFCTRSGRPLDRSNICHEMKKLCQAAQVDPQKVFPHNLRHLFARRYYAVEKNLVHLADILGHSSMETTRIYIATSIREHERVLRKMQLLC